MQDPADPDRPDKLTKKVYAVLRYNHNAKDGEPNVDLIDIKLTNQSARDLAASMLNGYVQKVFASK